MILPCECKNEFQDKEYGQSNRVHNLAVKLERGKRTVRGFCCTVCGKLKPSSSD